MIQIRCECGCGRMKMVREADVKRGWGRFFSKSCKAKDQERHTGQYATYKRKNQKTVDGIPVEGDYLGITDQEHDQIMIDSEMGWDAYKGWFK
jgi:hypothetical protein